MINPWYRDRLDYLLWQTLNNIAQEKTLRDLQANSSYTYILAWNHAT